MLFKNNTHQEVWRQRWCETCFQPDEATRRIQGKDTQCPIWAAAMRSGRKPVAWERMPRADEMERSIRCNAYEAKPALTKINTPSNPLLRNVEPLFAVDDLHHHGNTFVPIEGWPNRSADSDGVDHA